jgi:hypothetical protein
MFNQPYQIHENDRAAQARSLGLTLPEFDRLVSESNNVYNTLFEMGPFYGKEEVKEPTFRITAEPVVLPKGSRKILEDLGNDLVALGRSLKNLSSEYKEMIGSDLDFNLPPTWRIDIILDKKGKLRVNEIEGRDGASALMIAEQIAYNLVPFNESTAAKMVPAIKALVGKETGIKLALIRLDIANDAYTVNADRFIKYINFLSSGDITIDHLNETEIRAGNLKPDWSSYDGVLNEGAFSPSEIFGLGVKREQLLSAGNFNAMVNKGTIALLFDEKLESFWNENLGKECFKRLKKLLITSRFINSEEELDFARKQGKVVKASWAGNDISLINRSKGVALPVGGTLTQGSEERWDLLKDLIKNGVKMVWQDYVEPAKIPAFLRKRGTSLEKVEWHNRICVKYVVNGDPNAQDAPKVSLTATEVTLGPNIVPAGRACAYTAGAFDL